MAERDWCTMKILLTGDKGFVGRNIKRELTFDGHTVIGLEAEPHFHGWLDKFEDASGYYDVLLRNVDAIIHAGAIAANQSTDPSIFLWNSYATLALAKYCKSRYGSDIPFIFFSSFQVNVVETKPDKASWYGWSKKYAEECLKEVLPGATIFRPCVMWGDEQHKRNLKSTASVPFQLLSHQLEFLYKNWGRDYIYISDVVEAVRVALHNKPAGIFNLTGEYWWNEDLVKLTDWCGYKIIDHHAVKKNGFNSDMLPQDVAGLILLPNWSSQASLKFEFKRMEGLYNANHTG